MSAITDRVRVLVDQLTASGNLTDDRWRRAVNDTPRHLFIPNTALAAPFAEDAYVINREAAPDAWWNAVYSNTAIVTQLDDGATDITTGKGDYTCSSSAPGILFDFLELLDPYDFDEVMEIGTGTGWTAALLSARLSDDNITTIEVDPQIATDADKNLKAAGYSPRLITGDGAKGWPTGAPYDCVHVTCGVTDIPYSWIEQTRPGGVIVLPWIPGYGDGHVVRLQVAGEIAVGRFYGGSNYMLMRAQRRNRPDNNSQPRISSTFLDPRRVTRSSWGADVALAGMLPQVSRQTADTTNEEGSTFDLWLWDDQSSAHVTYSPEYKRSAVEQSGPRNLWDETESAYLQWVRWGSPARERFGMTVTPHGQHIWLDRPENVISLENGRQRAK